MKKRSMLYTSAVLSLAAVMMLSGCSGQESAESATETATEAVTETTAAETTTAETTTETTEATEAEEPVLKIIGEESDAEGVVSVNLINATGKEIEAFEIKSDSDEDFSDNLLEKDDIFAKDEERIFFQKTEKDAVYTIRLTFDSGETAEIHEFPFDDMESCEIKLEGSTAYIEYVSLKTDEKVSTKDAELKFAESEKEEEEAPQENVSSSQGNSSGGSGSSGNTQQTQPAATEPAPVDPPDVPDDPNAGCIGDGGLFY